jgi:hypothetical protein
MVMIWICIPATDGCVASEWVRSDCGLTCRMTAVELDMSKETVRTILVQDLGGESYQRSLMEEQKDRHLTLC